MPGHSGCSGGAIPAPCRPPPQRWLRINKSRVSLSGPQHLSVCVLAPPAPRRTSRERGGCILSSDEISPGPGPPLCTQGRLITLQQILVLDSLLSHLTFFSKQQVIIPNTNQGWWPSSLHHRDGSSLALLPCLRKHAVLLFSTQPRCSRFTSSSANDPDCVMRSCKSLGHVSKPPDPLFRGDTEVSGDCSCTSFLESA